MSISMSNEHIGKQLIAPTHTTNTLNFSNWHFLISSEDNNFKLLFVVSFSFVFLLFCLLFPMCGSDHVFFSLVYVLSWCWRLLLPSNAKDKTKKKKKVPHHSDHKNIREKRNLWVYEWKLVREIFIPAISIEIKWVKRETIIRWKRIV